MEVAFYLSTSENTGLQICSCCERLAGADLYNPRPNLCKTKFIKSGKYSFSFFDIY